MKKNELRIGNLVKVRGEIVKVEQITKKKIGYHKEPRENVMHYARLWEIEPIDLTEEVLLKIGFKKEERINSILYYLDYEINEDEYIRVKYLIYNSKTLPLLRITSPSANIYESHELTKRGIKYLHQLQNAYYCLTNEELEVKL